MGKRARWLLFGVALLIAVGFGWAKLRCGHEPVARWPLLDGTELRLEYVTYGTHHVIPGAGKLAAWFWQKASLLPHSRIPSLKVEYTRDTDEPCPVLWFTCRDSQTGKFVSVPIENGELIGEPYPNQSFNSAWDHTMPQPNLSFVVPCYDRRRPSFRVRVEASHKTLDIEVPNPVAGAVFPEWKPEPLPQTRRVGNLEVILRPLEVTRLDDGTLHVFPHFEVLEAGHPAEDIDVYAFFSDATGNTKNQGAFTNMLPLTEPAWKVRATFSRAGGDDGELKPVDFIVAPPKLPEPKSEPDAR